MNKNSKIRLLIEICSRYSKKKYFLYISTFKNKFFYNIFLLVRILNNVMACENRYDDVFS